MENLNQILMIIWPSLLLFIIFLIIGLFHQLLLKNFLAFNILVASIAIFFKWQYNITITEDILLSGLINDFSLTTEMVSTKLILWIFITSGLPIAFIFLTKIKTSSMTKKFIHTLSLTLLVFAGMFVVLFAQGYEFRAKGQIRDPKFSQALSHYSPLDAEYNFKKALRAYKKMGKLYTNVEIMSHTHHYTSKQSDLLVVFVLGESTRGDHFSINGYQKETNPLLSKKDGLISFTNVQSCDTLTINSVRCLASPMKKSHIGRDVVQSSFNDVFRSLGFSTDIYSLQTLNEFYHYLGYDTLMSKYAILNKQNTGAKDVSLLPYAQKAIRNYTSGKKLLILHTLGSHQSYYDRITSEQNIFSPACKIADVAKCSQEEIINAYDNTIIAIDSFLSTLIDELSNKNALLVYVSDHGESLGENGNYFHGKPINIAPKEQFNIPFIVWFSEKYRNTEEGHKRFESIKMIQRDVALSHDNLFHSILGCAAIESNNEGIDPSLNICALANESL